MALGAGLERIPAGGQFPGGGGAGEAIGPSECLQAAELPVRHREAAFHFHHHLGGAGLDGRERLVHVPGFHHFHDGGLVVVGQQGAGFLVPVLDLLGGDGLRVEVGGSEDGGVARGIHASPEGARGVDHGAVAGFLLCGGLGAFVQFGLGNALVAQQGGGGLAVEAIGRRGGFGDRGRIEGAGFGGRFSGRHGLRHRRGRLEGQFHGRYVLKGHDDPLLERLHLRLLLGAQVAGAFHDGRHPGFDAGFDRIGDADRVETAAEVFGEKHGRGSDEVIHQQEFQDLQ